MEGKYAVTFGQTEVGIVQMKREGLYWRFCCRCQLSGDVVCRLVVHTVGHAGIHPQNGMEPGTGSQYHLMGKAGPVIKIAVLADADIHNILVQTATKIHIHQLFSPADTQDGFSGGYEFIQNGPLPFIPLYIRLSALRVHFLSIKMGLKISAAGHQ